MKHPRVFRRKKNWKIYSTLSLVVLLVVTSAYYILRIPQDNQDIRSNAADPGFCEDKCIGQDRCGKGPADDPAYNGGNGDPCCEELKKTGDPFACAWPWRGYCTDDQCNAIPEGVNRERCGGPRHSWCNLCVEANCPGYGNSPNPTATKSPVPTKAPTKTPKPTKVPTATKVPVPTLGPSPASSPTAGVFASPTSWQNPQITETPFNNYPTEIPEPTFSIPSSGVLIPKFGLPRVDLEGLGNWWDRVRASFLDFFHTYAP